MKDRLKLNLEITNQTGKSLPSQKAMEAIILDTLKSKKIHYPVEIGLRFCSPNTIQKLNLKYRQIDQPTDVLSFPVQKKLPATPPPTPVLLGDIVICPEIAQKDDILNLIAHGTLHLLGYHHK